MSAKTKAKPESIQPNATERRYCVMKAHNWACITVAGFPMLPPSDGPCAFIPIFDTREQAIAWDNGCAYHVFALEQTSQPVASKTANATPKAKRSRKAKGAA